MNSKILSATLLIASTAMTHNATAADTTGLSGSGELGYSSSSGNTDNQSLYGKLSLNYTQTGYEILSLLEATQREENGSTTEERYLLDTQGNIFYNATRDYYSFIGARFEKNQFANIDLDSTYSLGMGKKLINTETMTFAGEAGVGYQTTDFTVGDSDNQTVAKLKLDFGYQVNSNVKLSQNLMTWIGDQNTKYEANSALKVKMTDAMKVSLAYKYRHNTDPAIGVEKTDNETLLTLIYDF